MAIRVLIADDAPSMRSALGALIRSDPRLELVGSVGDADEAIRVIEETRPDVALVDVQMPGGGGARVGAHVRAHRLGVVLIACSAHDDRGSVLAMMRAGAVGYVLKGGNVDEIVEVIHAAFEGQIRIEAEAGAEILQDMAREFDRSLRDREELEHIAAEVQAVIERGEGLAIVFQPIVRLEDRVTVGLEALSRFDSQPPRGPDEWFERAGLIGRRVELELTALRKALGNLGRIPAPLFLAVNVSPETALSDPFRELVSRIAGPRVVLELTEDQLIKDYVSLMSGLELVRGNGCRLAMDDTGAGYTSLRHIVRLAPEIVKCDRELVEQISTDKALRAVVRGVIALAEEIEALVIAEGIETEEQLATLRSLGILYGQGFFLGRPAPLAF